MYPKRIVSAVIVCASVSVVSGASVFHVPSQHPTIQGAINVSSNGDTIIVAEGQYAAFTFGGKNVTVTGPNPLDPAIAEKVVINGTVSFSGGETSACLLTGVMVTGGNNPGGYGGGIAGNETHATIEHCIVRANKAATGGGIGHFRGSVIGCIIEDNVSTSGPGGGGGGIGHSRGAVIRDCTFRRNHAVYVGGGVSQITALENCLFEGNSAGWTAAAIDNYQGDIVSCTIVGNSGDSLLHNNFGNVVSSIIWGNGGTEIYDPIGGVPSISDSCVEGGYPGGNIADDPLFVSGPMGPYCVSPGSPAEGMGFSYTWVPEPATLFLLAVGAVTLRRRSVGLRH